MTRHSFNPWHSPLSTAVGAFVLVSATRRALLGGGGVIDRVPYDPLAYALVALMALGGLLVIVGSQWRGTGVFGRAVERAGLYLAGSSWLAHTVTLIPNIGAVVAGRGYPDLFDVALGAILAIGCIAKAIALRRVDRHEEAVQAILEREEGH